MTISKFIIAGIALAVATATAPALARDEEPIKREGNAIKKIEQVIDKLERFELPDTESVRENPPSFFVGPQGAARIISGEVTSVASTTIGVRVWGLTLSVNVSGSRFLPNGTTAANLQVGDKVNVRGAMQSNGTVNATLVHEPSARNRMSAELIQEINKLIARLREVQERFGLPLTPFVSTTTSAQ